VPALKTSKPTIAEAPQLLRVSDLSAGIELRQSPSLLKPSQARLLRNWSLQEPGALLVFPGWESFSTASLGSRRIQGGQRVYLDGVAPFNLASDNGNVYKPSDAGVWGAAVLASRSTTTQHYFPHDRDFVAQFDGVNIPKKSTDGTTWTQMGIDAPSVAPSASAVAGGSLIAGNTYEVSYSYVDSELGHEGNESARDTQAVAGADLTVRVAVTASADAQVDGIYVYVRDVTAGETVRRRWSNTASANANANLDITSNTWTSNDPAPSDHNVPLATLGWALPWKNRWWAADRDVKNRIYFTQIFEPQSWPTLFFIDIPFVRGDEIAAMAAHGDTLVVWGKSSQAFVIIGQTSLDFEVRPALGAQAGALGPRAVAVIENGIVHVAAEGVYIFDGASDRLLSYNIDPGWQDYVTRSTAADLEKTATVYHGLRKELSVSTTRLYPWGAPGEWILDLNRTRTQEIPAWTSTDRPVGGYIIWDGNETTLGNRGRLFSWSQTVAKLFEERTGTTADGADMVADAEHSTHATGGYVARFGESYIEHQPAVGSFAITPVVDGSALGSQTLSINTGLLFWGDSSAPYGTASRTYGGRGRIQEPFQLPMTAEGRTLAFRSRYTGQGAWKWFTYATNLIPESELRGR
jgi:hypothetical protein